MKEIEEVCKPLNIQPSLLAAIVMTESSGNRLAHRYEANYQWLWEVKENAKRLGCSEEQEKLAQMTSYGLTQVMGSVCRQLGHQDWLSEMFEVVPNLKMGARHLKQFIARYPAPITDAISAYNQGSPKKDAKGKYLNQAYVDKVLGYKQIIEKKDEA